MALNLSTLTNPATSGGILAEALTTADFLDPVPILKNLSRGSNKGGDAKQTTGLNQPKALPLIKNPAGNLGGYLYIPDVAGNYATGPSVTIGANQTWEGELDMVISQFGNFIKPMGGGFWSTGFGLLFYSDGGVNVLSKTAPTTDGDSGVTLRTPFNVKYGFDGTDIYVDIDGVRKFSETAPSQAASITHTLELAQQNNLSHTGNYAIQKAKLTVNNAVVFDCDFNGSTSIRHGDTKFNCVGGPVVLTKAGNDPVTVVKKSVLRFSDAANTGLQGLFNQTITEGYFFAALSVLGDGGESLGRIFSANSTGAGDFQGGGFTLRRFELNHQMQFRWNGGSIVKHNDVFNGERGDFLLESILKDGDQTSKINNADADDGASAFSGAVSSEEFGIGSNTAGDGNACIDLEYLALFPATITDDQADSVRNYINNRNNVFDLKDGFGYYFYDAQAAPVGAITTGSASWNGRIVGSDNGDSDRYLTQGTTNDAPVGDGYVVTFADNTDHLDIPSTTQAGWQVVGTSLGTFAYRVDNDAVTELNLLGNLGNASFRQAGDLYGIILLPESATGADIEEARKLLIDRGAADGVISTSYYTNWIGRNDIVEFKAINFSSATSVSYAWHDMGSLLTFPSIDLTNTTDASNAWSVNTETSLLSSFGTTEIPNCTNFSSSWQNCSSLQSFPAGAKLGTEVNYVNFQNAWRGSGLTSFPALDLSNGDNFTNAWRGTNYLTEIASGLQLGNNPAYTGVSFTRAWQDSGLTSFPALDLSRGNSFDNAWLNCSALTSFPSGAKLGTSAVNVNFTNAWRSSGLTSFSTPLTTTNRIVDGFNSCTLLTDFSADVFANWNPQNLASGVFHDTWKGCSALSAISVQNILTSLDASGQHGTYDGTSTGNPLGDSGIDIDYNVATGSLSAATNTAVTSLKSKGWVIVVNGVTL